MRNILFTGIISSLMLVSLSGCYKTCTDPMSPNYTLKGDCIDATSSITGTYSGQLVDSVVGLHSTTSAITIQIAKVDASHVTVASSGTPSFISYSAAVSSSSNGYYLTVPAQTVNGLSVSGAGAYFGNAADGIYVTTGKSIAIYILAGTEYEGFTGTQQQ